MQPGLATKSTARGYTALELAFSVAIFAVIILSSLALVSNDAERSRSVLGIGVIENQAQQMLFKLEHEIANSNGFAAAETLAQPLSSGNTQSLSIADTHGFPPSGRLLLGAGTAKQEIIEYTTLGVDSATFLSLERGASCSTPAAHPTGTSVRWAGFTTPSPTQSAGAIHNGQSLEPSGPVFFRGDGTGFSYRIPVDPTGGTDYVHDGEIRWGSEAAVNPTDGWVALRWEAASELSEAETQTDINGDGDQQDVFEIGQIQRIAWDASDPKAPVQELGLGPTAVLQEKCQYGSDLDGDGLEDPIFLWEEESGRLHIRMTVIGVTKKAQPTLRHVQSIIFMRNDPGA